MMKLLALVEEGGQKVFHAVEVLGHSAICVERLLVDGQKLEPVAKLAILSIVKSGETLATAIVAAGSAEGTNWIADAGAVEAVREFVAAFLTALPVLKSAAEVLAADVKDPVINGK